MSLDNKINYANVPTSESNIKASLSLEMGSVISNIGWTTDHAKLFNLDFSESGHTGFAGFKSDTTANWDDQPELIPEKGVLIIYTDYAQSESGEYIPGMKIGDGETMLSNLQFISQDMSEEIADILQDILNIKDDVSDIQDWIDTVKMDGGEVV